MKPALIALAEDLLRGETRDFLLIYGTEDGAFQICATNKTWALGALQRASRDIPMLNPSEEP